MISLESEILSWRGLEVKNPARVRIGRGVTALTGANGSGKSVLGRIMASGWNVATNRIISTLGRPKIALLEFNDLHSLPGCRRAAYYQQRYEAAMNDDMPTVAELLGDRLKSEAWHVLADELNMTELAEKRVNYLSSGELRKLLIVNQLVESPDLVILDNPYIGLDSDSRVALDGAIERMSHRGVSFLLIAPERSMLPGCVTAEISMSNLTVSYGGQPCKPVVLPEYLPGVAPEKMSGPLVELADCSVVLGGRRVLHGVNWVVNAGEVWSLSGANGSGKSTLLSLITADNPQAYRCDIRLFGRRRGSGESIWDIKRRMAYVSPEIHTYFNGGNSTVESIVAHGLHDCVGDYKRVSADELELAREWLGVMSIAGIADRRFNTLSAGEQRMTLLARAFVKRAPLVILDEPLHGLDEANRRLVSAVVELVARESTLIYITHDPKELPSAVTGYFQLEKQQA